jgi:copper transport protein
MPRVGAAALLAATWLVLAAAPADAHALVRSSDPASGALLQTAPAEVLITFTEPPDPSLSVIRVLDSNGRDVENGKAKVPAGDRDSLTVALARLPKGVYTVTWRTVSKTDGHVTAGSFAFGVGVSPEGAAPPGGSASIPASPSPPPLGVAGRWAFYWGLAVLLGGGVFLGHITRTLPRGSRAIIGGAWLLAAAGLVAMAVAERSAVGVSYGALFDSHAGRQLLARGAALLVGGIGVGIVLVQRRWTAVPPLGLAAAAGLLVHAYAGHAAAASSQRWFNLTVQWLHLVAVSVWIGGLVWLFAVLLDRSHPDRGVVVRRFSTLAGFALAVVVATGVARELDEVGWPGSWARLVDTAFGITLLVKVGLVAGLVALGARNRYANVPKATASANPGGWAALQRTVGAELALAVAVLAVAALLSELPPSAEVAASRHPSVPAQVVVSGNDFSTSVRVRLVVTPGTVGPNVFQASVTDFDTGRPVPARRVAIRFSLPDRPELGTPKLDLSRTSGGLWRGTGTGLSIEGRWNLAVLVQEATGGVEVPLVLQTRLPPERITVTRAAGQPTLYSIALPGGGSVQTYVDPGKAGKNQVHFTFFRASGDEQPIASATATEMPPSGSAGPITLTRFDPGHFVANVRLEAGRWRFRIRATTAEGEAFDAYFDQSIGS